MKLFSDRNRPVHLGPLPLERLDHAPREIDWGAIPPMEPLGVPPAAPGSGSFAAALAEYQCMLDVLRDGPNNAVQAACPKDPQVRANHLKAFGYFNDCTAVGICALAPAHHLAQPIVNPGLDRLASQLKTQQVVSLAAGIEHLMADLREAAAAPATGIGGHGFALVFLHRHNRDPRSDEPGGDWIGACQNERAALLGSECASIIGQYLRELGFAAKAHSPSASDVDLNRLAVSAGLADESRTHPLIGDRFGLSAVTTNMTLAVDAPLASEQPSLGLVWHLGGSGPGQGFAKSARSLDPYAKRDYVLGAQPFETLKRTDEPTTFIDEPRVPRVPKRSDMFARMQFGDMGAENQANSTGGKYVLKAPVSAAQRRALSALILLQAGEGERTPDPEHDPIRAAENIKAALYFLGADAVGISRCPQFAWYSHNALGEAIDPPHDQAISVIIDQGFETTAGTSGDDWISVAQSMRAYLRFSLLGGVVAKQIRQLGYSAKAHTVVDGDVLQPPLLLLSGLGEVSRIGEVILNPFLGPRLKSGVITTDMPVAHDKPIDFGLQRFCESCNKCARECPSGAITAGPKLMFNGYEIWKSDSQKCASYRVGTEGGAMCGRCMKTCPWNLEGLFAEAPFRWAAMNLPAAAPLLAKLDDAVGNGGLNPVKKWWWDLERQSSGGFDQPDKPVNARDLQRDLKLKPEDQTLAVYPANLAPHPWPFPFPMDREAGIDAYQAMITAEHYKLKLARGETDGLTPPFQLPSDAPVQRVVITNATREAPDVMLYELKALDDELLPRWTAGAHIDIVVSPEFLRQYSLTGDPADASRYLIAVKQEPEGRGGSKLMHRIFGEGRKIFISKPINHFALVETAPRTLLFGGGIGVTPLIAMAHRLHAMGRTLTLHYSVRSRSTAPLLGYLGAVPWDWQLHVSDEGGRADLDALMDPAAEIYSCGPETYMAAVVQAATTAGVPDERQHLEYFSVPEQPAWENHPFDIEIASTGVRLTVAADEVLSDVLLREGLPVDVKCSDGLCGVCQCGYSAGQVEHRDWVLSKAQRTDRLITCQSRGTGDRALRLEL